MTRVRLSVGLAFATFLPLTLAPLLAPSDGRGTGTVLGALVVIAYAGHVAVTGWLGTMPDVRAMIRARPGRLVAAPALLMVGSAMLVVTLPSQTVEWLLFGYFAWQFNHFQRQNLGLVGLMAAQWTAEPLSGSERRTIVAAGWCGTVALLCRPGLLGLSNHNVPQTVAAPAFTMATVGMVICLGWAVACQLRSASRPTPVTTAYFGAVLFMTPVFVFRAPAAAVTGMVVAHGLQYLWAVRWRSDPSGRTDTDVLAHWRHSRWRTAAGILVLAVVGGSTLEAMSELSSARGDGPRLLYGLYLGIVMAHFFVDGVVWKRSPRQKDPSTWPNALVLSGANGRV